MALINIVRLAHVAARTSEPESMRSHFVDVIGLWEVERDADGRIQLTVDGLGATIEIIPSDDDSLDHVAWEVAPGLSEQDLITALSVDNIEATTLERRDPGTVGGVEFTDPDGTSIHLVIPESDRKPRISRDGIAPLRLGHVAWTTPDPLATRAFYEEKLGFRWSDTIEDLFVFLRHGADHHSLNLVRNEHPGVIQHIAFELRDWAHVQSSSEELALHRIPVEWGPGRHGAGSNVFTYHKSPLCIIELYVEMDRMSHPDQGYWDTRPWHVFSPHQPRQWAFADFGSMNTYGPGVPASMRE